ncbi:predicted protein [Sclerotinia sclerotiorum 1980 UF-70]|uniref:Uncharacterized protein n=1 Tax=Sclerotinia sclerotiorum (strain ATCC 18683 / 1980 / Ss-1) TaxID=665079 RepID=A7EEH1_SCLS1|nr:predicted protein [Sclerotinia sclerotiorum 1980 UF-70]EDO01237.1 predicted protein [Sclerotinia sclerotiorum 1980 UF-70]
MFLAFLIGLEISSTTIQGISFQAISCCKSFLDLKYAEISQFIAARPRCGHGHGDLFWNPFLARGFYPVIALTFTHRYSCCTSV